jgi:hypothetical protein
MVGDRIGDVAARVLEQSFPLKVTSACTQRLRREVRRMETAEVLARSRNEAEIAFEKMCSGSVPLGWSAAQ